MAVLTWWLLLQVMGWVALPLVFRLLRWLPDRGYSVAKPAGLLLGNYALWLLGTLGWLRNTTGGILLAFGLVALFGAWVYQRWNDGPNLLDWLRAHRSWILAYELVFLIAFAAWAIFRAHNPDLSTTEKPMEFAFMNAIHRSPAFPPPDPWLSGFTISYYYFGYVMMSTLAKLSGVSSGVAFSLSNALWFALTAAGAFGIAANLAAASKRATTNALIAAGLLGAWFVPVLSNFQGPLEVAHANAIGSAGFWRWLDVQEINTSPIPRADGEARWPLCAGCSHPRGSWWFWRASRVVHDYPLGSDRSVPAEYQELIDEFPFFSFLLGDMHPHVLALPYALMSMALAFNVFRMGSESATGVTSHRPERISWRQWFWEAAPIWVTYPVFLGALSFLNTWDFPIHVFIVVLAWGLGRWMWGIRPETRFSVWSIWNDAAIALVACGVIGVVAYLPFYIGFRSQAAGIVPNLYNPTRLPQFFVMFGPFLLIGAAFVLALLARAVRQRRLSARRAWLGSLAGGAGAVAAAAILTVAAAAALFAVSGGARAKFDEWSRDVESKGISLNQVVVERIGEFSVPLLLGVSMAAIVLIVRSRLVGDGPLCSPSAAPSASLRTGLGTGASGVSESRLPQRLPPLPPQSEESDSASFALMLFGSGALLAFAVEYVYLLDQFGTRMNTVFKLYYQAWALWGVASAYAVYYLWRSSERLTSAIGRVAFEVVLAVSVAGGLVYPLLTIPDKIDRGIAPTLDARMPTVQFAPDEAAAIEWLVRNAGERAVILEAEGQSYHDGTSRVSGWTGLSGVLGWVGHEGQWRGNYDDISPRQADIDRIYSAVDAAAVLALLRKYRVDYVYVGPNEIAKYPPEGLAKFDRIMDMVFQQGSSTIYRLPTAGGAPPAE